MAYSNANPESTFVALIDRDGNIRDMSATQRNAIVGIDWQREDEYKRTIADMQETIDNYFNKLVELGAITIPKSPEEIAQETASEQLRIAQEQAIQQAQINQALLGAIESLSAEVKELKTNGSNRNADGLSGEQSGNDSKGIRATRSTSKGGASTRAANAPGNS